MERTKQEILRLCHAGLDSKTFRVETVRRLRKLIPVDDSFFATADPATLLFTSAVVCRPPGSCSELEKSEVHLTREGCSVATFLRLHSA